MTRNRRRGGPASKVILASIIEIAAVVVSIPIGFIGATKAAKEGIAGAPHSPSERRLGLALLAVAIVLPMAGPGCAWLSSRSRAALVVAGAVLAGTTLFWLSYFRIAE